MGGEQYAEWNYTGSVTINSGATLTVATNAVLNWNNGGVEGDLTVAQGGVLNLTNNATYSIYGALTNNGTVNWSPATFTATARRVTPGWFTMPGCGTRNLTVR